MSNSKSRLEKRRRRSIIAFEMIRLDRKATEPPPRTALPPGPRRAEIGQVQRWFISTPLFSGAGCEPGNLKIDR